MTAQDGGRQVLLVDDDPTMLLLLEHVFEGLGRSYETASNGEEALKLWQAARHTLVVLDIEMPGLDGLEVCRRIRATEGGRDTFIVVVTGRDRAADLEDILDAGPDDYVAKPASGQQLVARMRIALRRMADDRARREAEAALRKSRYLEGIGEALVTLQHEINNPLAGLMATAELLLLENQARGAPTEDLATIVSQAQRISALVRRMGELRNPQPIPYAGNARMLDLKHPEQS